jgi:hypothetical protein
MDIENKLIEFADDVNKNNELKNIFYINIDGTTNLILPNTIYDFLVSNNYIIKYIKALNSKKKIEFIRKISTYCSTRMISTICTVNQFVSIDRKFENETNYLYHDFMCRIVDLCESNSELNYKSVKELVENHQRRIQKIFYSKDELKYIGNTQKYINRIPCSEYSAQLQIRILRLQIAELKEPILDIGCGYNGNLVEYFREKGLEAYGIDRIVSSKKYLLKSNWLHEIYGDRKWGTVISHMAFSNHFYRSHLKNSNDFIIYANKYMEILKSIKVKGEFIYSPDLPFIECFLTGDNYQICKQIIDNKSEENMQLIEYVTRIRIK